MTRDSFQTVDGTTVPAVTAGQMREIDRHAVEEVGLELLQMMENAGRNLAAHARELRAGGEEVTTADAPVTILAGGGGNGGGGLCAARHLVNRGVPVEVVLDRDPGQLDGAAATQFRILREMDVEVAGPKASDGNGDVDSDSANALSDALATASASAGLIIDAIIGYSLRGAPRGRAKELIEVANDADVQVLSLDVPSGYDATTGDVPGVGVSPARTLTLALPKTGLDAVPGDLYLADIGIPATVYDRVAVEYDPPFRDDYWVELAK